MGLQQVSFTRDSTYYVRTTDCNSVCPSVRLSVTTRYRFKPRWDRDFGFTTYDSV